MLKPDEAVEHPKELCREFGVHQQSFYNYKSKYSGTERDAQCLSTLMSDFAFELIFKN